MTLSAFFSMSCAAGFVLLLGTSSATANPITKANTGTNLSLGATWTGGVAPGSGDVVIWDTGSVATGLTFGANTSWQGITLNAGETSAVTITGANTLTLGISGIDMSAAAANLTVGATNSTTNLTLGGSQTWTVASGRTFAFQGNQVGGLVSGPSTLDLGGNTLTIAGSGTTNAVSLIATHLQNGTINLNSGILNVQGSGSTNAQVDSTVAINVASGATYNIAYNSGSGSIYNQALTLNGGTLNKGDGTANTVAFGGTIALGTGGGTITNSGGGVWTIGSAISGSTALTINGAGSIALSGTSNYTGSTTINGSNQSFTVTVASLANGGSNSSIGASTNAASNLILTNSGVLSYVGTTVATTDRLFQLGNTTAADTGTIANNAATANTLSFTNTGALTYGTANQTRTLILSGTNTGANSFAPAIGDNGTGAVSLSKTGAGTWSLSGGNTFSGATTVSAGTLTLDYSTNNTSKLSDTAALTLSGGTLNLSGGTHTEVVGSTTLTAAIASNITRTSGSSILALGAITRGAGATLNIGTSGIATTTTAVTASGAFGSWLTIGGTSLATKDGSNDIIGVTYTDTAIGGVIADGATNNARITGATGSVTLGSLVTNAATLTQTATGATTLDTTGKTFRLSAQGSILSATGAGTLTIGATVNSGGLTAGGTDSTAGVLDFDTRGNAITVNSTITNNGTGAVSLTKIGANDLTLAGTNSYSGGTTLSGGALRVSNSSALGTGALTVDTTATLATASGSKTVVLANALTIGSGVTLSVDGGFADLSLTGAISGAGAYKATSSGNVFLTNTANSFSGGTTLAGSGTLWGTVIGNTGSNGSFGSANTITISTNSALGYLGAGETTNKTINFSTTAGGQITNNAASSSATALTLNSVTAANAAMLVQIQGGSDTVITNGITGNSSTLNFKQNGIGTTTIATTGAMFGSATASTITYGAGVLVLNGSTAVNETLSRSIGATAQFGSSSAMKLATVNTNSILGGYATFGGTGWAANSTNAAGGTVVALAAASYTPDTATSFTGATANEDVQATITNAATGSANSLRFNTAGAQTLTLATGNNFLTSGGILVTNAVGSNTTTLTGGTLMFGTSGVSSTGDIVVNNFNTGTVNSSTGVATGGNLVIGSAIANNATGGTTSLTVAGPGITTLTSATQSYTGITFVEGGATLIQNGTHTSGAYQVAADSTLYLKNGYGGSGPAVTVNGAGTTATTGLYLNGGQTYGIAALNLTGAATTIHTYGTGVVTLSGFDTNAIHLTVANTASGSVIGSNINVTTSSFGYVMNVTAGANTATGDITFGGALGGTGSTYTAGGVGMNYEINRTGATGSINLTGTSTSLGYAVEAGSLILSGGNNRLPTNAVVVLGGANNSNGNANGAANALLVLNGVNQQLANLATSGTGTANAVVGGSSTLSTLTINNSASATFAGTIGGLGVNQNNIALTNSGTGSLTLSGTNTYTGATTVSAGKLVVTGSIGIASAVSVASAATLGGTGSVGSVTVASGGIIEAGVGGAGSLTLSSLTFSSGGTITIGPLSTYTSTAAINDLGNLTAGGTVTLNLSTSAVGAGTYHLVAHSNSLADLSSFVLGTVPALGGRQSGTLMNDAGFIDYVVAGDAPKWTGAVSSEWSTNTLANPKNWQLITSATATDYLTGDTVLFDDTAANKTVNISVADVTPTSVQFNNSTGNDYTLNGPFAIAGATSLAKTGTGTVNINNANSYTGGTTLAAGTIRVNNNSALGTGTLAVTGNATLGTTVGGSATTLGNAVTIATLTTLTLDSSNASLILSGGISGAGSLATTGTGTTTLTGTSSYSGTTTVSTGTTLQIGNGGTTGTLATGATTVTGVLNFNLSGPLTVSSAISGTGTVTQNGSGNLILTGSTMAQNLTVNSGTVTAQGTTSTGGSLFGANYMTGTGQVTVNAGATLIINNAHALGGDNGTMTESVTVNGGTITETHEQYYNNLTLNGATVNGSNEMRTSAASNIVVGGTAASNISANVDLLNNPGNFNVGVTGDPNADLNISGTVLGPSALNKSGLGTVALTGNNTNTGAVNINAGTLLADNSSNTGSATGAGAVTVTASGTLGGRGYITTTNQNITINGTLIVGHANDSFDPNFGSTPGRIELNLSSGSGTITFGSAAVVKMNLFGDNFAGDGVDPNPMGAGLYNDTLHVASTQAIQINGSRLIVADAGTDTNNHAANWVAGDSWQLFDWSQALGGITGNFSISQSDLPTLTDGLKWDTSQLLTTGIISVTVVPEPSRVLLLLGGLLAATARRPAATLKSEPE